jgi:hypothetical protein
MSFCFIHQQPSLKLKRSWQEPGITDKNFHWLAFPTSALPHPAYINQICSTSGARSARHKLHPWRHADLSARSPQVEKTQIQVSYPGTYFLKHQSRHRLCIAARQVCLKIANRGKGDTHETSSDRRGHYRIGSAQKG